jgi:hypothetical protein
MPEVRNAAWPLMAAGLWLLGGCGGDSGPAMASSISQTEASAVGTAAASQLGGVAGGLAQFSSPSVGGVGAGVFGARAPTGRFVAATVGRVNPRIRQGLALLQQDCTPAVSDPTDTDQDGIEDNATVVFSAANCTFVDATTGLTVSATGTVHIQDTDNTTTVFGYDLNFTRFQVMLTDPTGAYPDISTGINGSYTTTVTLLTASATENVATDLTVAGSRVYVDHSVWTVAYDPAQGSIDPANATLPAGNFTVDGNYTYAGDADGRTATWSFGINTTAPLAYDGSCTDVDWPFSSGQVNVYLSGRQTVGFTVDYAGCGSPGTVTAFDNTAT